MRVLHVGKYFLPYAGGMEMFLADLLHTCQARGVESAAIVHAHDRASVSTGARDEMGVEIIRVPSWGRLLYAPISPQFPAWLERTIARFKPDVLHLHLPNTSAFWALRSKAARKIPWVVHWHSDVVASRLDKRLALAYPFYRPFEQALLARARAIVVTSPPYLEASQALAPWREKCHAVPLGLNPQRCAEPDTAHQAWAESQWDGAQFRILTIGRMTYYKGHETLIRAMAELPDARLVLVGDGERKNRLRALVQSLGLSDRVILAGYRPDPEVGALLASCDVFCLPSVERTEAFGMSILEAMRHARPVVASRIEGSGVGWVVQDGVTGMLVPPANPGALAQALREMAANRDAAQKMGKAGEERFNHHFHINKIADKTIKIYNHVLCQ